jgi:superfamily II DNA or RNA helicase
VGIFKAHGVSVDKQDERTAGNRIDLSFKAELRPEQQEAVREILAHDQGVLSAPTALGKTLWGHI